LSISLDPLAGTMPERVVAARTVKENARLFSAKEMPMKRNSTDLGFSRRAFAKGGAAAAAAWAFTRPFDALAQGAGTRVGASPDYGELVEAIDQRTGLPLLKLPRGFRYTSLSWTGDLMTDGKPTPGGHDGGAVLFGGLDRIVYVRNHELSYSATAVHQSSFTTSDLTYDAGHAPGGTTNVEFDLRRGRHIRTTPSLSGTIRNCAGGHTPWNSWLTCEENLDFPGSGAAILQQTHGWVFDVPAYGYASPVPIVGMGRFNHEAATVDPLTGAVYLTEDTGTSGLYRYAARRYGRLHGEGKLQMLRVVGQPGLDTSTGLVPFQDLDVDWVDIADPDRRDDVAGDGIGVFMQGFSQGGASFRRGEGIFYRHGRIYFTCTSGGAASKGQVFELDPYRNKLRLIFESPGSDVLDMPDNLAVSPRGGILLCEDGSLVGQYMRGLTRGGQIFDFAQNNVVLNGEVNGIIGDFRGSEWAGADWTADGDYLFANIQTPGITFAITGPWHRGAL
jgi:secreted PhoX family phosphatase